MPNIKQSPCCARVNAKLIMEKANLRRLAIRAAKREEKGLSIESLTASIAESRARIAEDEKRIIEHDADHAGGGL